MTKHELTRTAAAAILVAFPVFGADPQVLPLTAATLEPHRVKIETVDYKGRKAIRLVKDAKGAGMALLKDTEFADGSIEVDVAVKVTSPPGVRNPGFIGIAFRSRSDASHYAETSRPHTPPPHDKHKKIKFFQTPPPPTPTRPIRRCATTPCNTSPRRA